MTTLNVYGMGPQGFLVNRKLKPYEQDNLLDVKRPASGTVWDDRALYRFNSTFVESVDKWYPVRGFIAMGSFLFMALALFGLTGLILLMIMKPQVLGLPVFLLFLGVLYFAGKMFCSDAFTLTHYPIRVNRKNRQVYAFRRDGTVLKAGWDDLVWTLYTPSFRRMDVFVIAHVMDRETELIKESFGLKAVAVGRVGEEACREHFEFFRRYMEGGPEMVLNALRPEPLVLLPRLDLQRETWTFGWKLWSRLIGENWIVMTLWQVVALPTSFLRWIVMKTSKIPQWPQWVEEECQVAPDDVWARDKAR